MRITRQELEVAVDSGRALTLEGHLFTSGYRKRLGLCLEVCLAAHDRGDLYPVVFAVLQELETRASISNIRRVFFLARGSTGDGLSEEEEATFQRVLPAVRVEEMRPKAAMAGLFLRTRLAHAASGLKIEVTNNAPHNAEDEERLRNLLRRAAGYNDVTQYFKDHPMDEEGREFGLAMSLLMLKEAKLQPELMRVGSSDGQFLSRLEIAFDPSFKSIRDRIRQGETIKPFDDTEMPDVPESTGKRVQCPVCHLQVDERIFFPTVTADMTALDVMQAQRRGWRPEDGACAGCIAMY
ncbi:MAG: hypothetical protein HY042_02025 [Spirochaetia bacterium]|nr:hypothetical protein [Spirochaetia bacterium]